MICRVADLYVQIPEAGGIASRCGEYLASGTADILITEDSYNLDRWQGMPYEDACYMESGFHFYGKLIQHSGMMCHASAVAYQGKAYLFSGPSTVGKSTHTRQWQKSFADVRVFNDDKPALRLLDGQWFAYGTPWCGKDGINENLKVPLGGICFLKQGPQNRIRRLQPREALGYVLSQTWQFRKPENQELHMRLVDDLLRNIPIFELENVPGEEAAIMSREALLTAAEA